MASVKSFSYIGKKNEQVTIQRNGGCLGFLCQEWGSRVNVDAPFSVDLMIDKALLGFFFQAANSSKAIKNLIPTAKFDITGENTMRVHFPDWHVKADAAACAMRILGMAPAGHSIEAVMIRRVLARYPDMPVDGVLALAILSTSYGYSPDGSVSFLGLKSNGYYLDGGDVEPKGGYSTSERVPVGRAVAFALGQFNEPYQPELYKGYLKCHSLATAAIITEDDFDRTGCKDWGEVLQEYPEITHMEGIDLSDKYLTINHAIINDSMDKAYPFIQGQEFTNVSESPELGNAIDIIYNLKEQI